MAALFLLVGAALFGAGLVRRACGAWLDAAEQALWGLVAGWALTTLCAYATARALGQLSFLPVLTLAALVWLAALCLWLPSLRKVKRQMFRRAWRPHYAGLALVLALFAPVYWLLFSTRMFRERADGLYSGGASFYDMPLHAAISNSFLHGQNFPPLYTPSPPEPLLYPFMPDFLTAVVMALGPGLWGALMLTGVPLALAATGIFYTLAWRVARSPSGAVVSTVLFFLNGGLGFVYFYGDWRQSGAPFGRFWSGLGRNYASMWDRQIHFGNVIADYLLPQRASLFGVPLTLMVFAAFAAAWRRWHEGDEAGRRDGWRVLLAAGVLAGALPFFHTHSYVAVGLVSVVLFVLRPRRAWLAFWLPALILAAPRLAELAGHVSASGGFLRLLPGWKAGAAVAGWPLYWLRNVGLPVLLVVPALVAAPRAWRTFYLAFAGLFLFALFVLISPNDIDNLKLIYYWHAATCVLVGAWLSRLAASRRLLPVVFALVLLSVASGVLALHHEGVNRARLFSRDEVEAAAFVRERVEPDALFLTAPVIHQPVLCLAGRAVLRGDARWLWSHGYDVRRREFDVRMIYAGGADAAERARRYGVDYIYLGAWEESRLRVDRAALERAFPVVYRNPGVTIFDARGGDGGGPRGRRRWVENLTAPREFAASLGEDPAGLFVEFDRIAFFVHRFYKVSYGRPPRMHELLADVTAVGQGVRVPAEGWERRLEENKRSFAEGWVERPAFLSAHGGEGGSLYVDSLSANAGLSRGADERGALARSLDAGAETRASVMRKMVDDPTLARAEFDTAFVLAHFFAYLRRNPDDPPDRDTGGLHFWVNELKRSGDYGSVSRAFLESSEYQSKVYGSRK